MRPKGEKTMKVSLKILAMALCLVFVISVCACLFAANTETNAAEYKDGEWVTVGNTFKFDGKDYTVNKDTNFSGEYITVDGADYYLLSDPEDIKTLATAGGNERFIIANDINLGVWTEDIFCYTTLIEGCGHTLTFGDGSTQGLLGSFAGTAKNIVFDGAISSSGHTGAFADNFLDGELHGIVNNADITEQVDEENETYYKIGGIIGTADLSYGNFLLQNCVNNGDISGTYRTGGIIGNLQTNPWNDLNASGVLNVIKCENNGDITATNQLSGGIISVCEFYGTGETNIIGCTNTGNIHSSSYAGGIVSLLYSTGTVEGCVNTGSVLSDNNMAGGIVADMQTAENGAIMVSNCANYGEIASVKTHVGGVVGQLKKGHFGFENCISVGTLTPGSVEAAGDAPATYGTAHGIACRSNFEYALDTTSNCYYTGADRGMNMASGESDPGTKLSDDQLTNNFVVVRFNSANETNGNPIRWKTVDGKPMVDLATVAEIASTTAATTEKATAASSTDKPVATTKAPLNAPSTTAADGDGDEGEKGGCGSSLTVASVVILTTTITGSALVVSRKRK